MKQWTSGWTKAKITKPRLLAVLFCYMSHTVCNSLSFGWKDSESHACAEWKLLVVFFHLEPNKRGQLISCESQTVCLSYQWQSLPTELLELWTGVTWLCDRPHSIWVSLIIHLYKSRSLHVWVQLHYITYCYLLCTWTTKEVSLDHHSVLHNIYLLFDMISSEYS